MNELALCMIVRNEAHGIARTLRSVAGIVDTWTILDTGSTDDTPAIVESELRSIPGKLHRVPFVDFATTRNVALELAGDAARFVLLLDADDVLEGPINLRQFIAKADEKEGLYHVRIQHGPSSFLTRALMASSCKARYAGAVHEILLGPDPRTIVPGVVLRREKPAQSQAATRNRWTRDVEILRAALAVAPGDTRSAFYLAMTHLWLGELELALEAFEARLELGGWWEELYESSMRIGGIYEAVAARGSTPPGVDRDLVAARESYARAAELAPHRAEPLCALAELERRRERWSSSYLHARRARELELPALDRLFVDTTAYTWRAADLVGISAWYLARELERHAGRSTGDSVRLWREGAAAARRALELAPEGRRERMAENLRCYGGPELVAPPTSPAPVQSAAAASSARPPSSSAASAAG